MIDPSISTQALFNAVGEENTAADYRFMPFDVSVGHEELLILWDDRGDEKARFDAALSLPSFGMAKNSYASSGYTASVVSVEAC